MSSVTTSNKAKPKNQSKMSVGARNTTPSTSSTSSTVRESSVPFLRQPPPVRSPTSSLRDFVLVPGTLKRYKRALHLFLAYCEENGLDDSFSFESLDSILCEYIDTMWRNDESKSLASNTVNAINFYLPASKPHLNTCRQLLRGWDRFQPKHSRPPLTYELTVVLAMSMLKGGHYDAAVATLLAFDCYLRIGELCDIRLCDVALSGDLKFGSAFSGSAVGLRHTKTGPNQFVSVCRPLVEELLSDLVHTKLSLGIPRSGLLFGLSSTQYRKIFLSTCNALGLSKYSFTPHSLRHGAATHDFLCHMPLEEILLRGRWRQPLSARTYIQSGRMLLLSVDEPQLLTLGADIVKSGQLLQIFQAYRPSSYPSYRMKQVPSTT
jgi:integrase